MIQSASTPARPQYHSSLPRRISLLASVGVLLPSLVLSVLFGIYLSFHLEVLSIDLKRIQNSLLRDSVGEQLQAYARNEAARIDAFFFERLVDVRVLATAPIVVESAVAVAGRHRSLGFRSMSIEEVEAYVEREYGGDRKIAFFPKTDLFLRHYQLANVSFLEVFFTDRDGYNVSTSSPTSDFVQRDEEWWQSAWSSEIYVGPVEYDTSAGAYSIDIAVRIDDPKTGLGWGCSRRCSVSGVSSRCSMRPPRRLRDFVFRFSRARAKLWPRPLRITPPTSLCRSRSG